jgi:hypothetical protein
MKRFLTTVAAHQADQCVLETFTIVCSCNIIVGSYTGRELRPLLRQDHDHAVYIGFNFEHDEIYTGWLSTHTSRAPLQ